MRVLVIRHGLAAPQTPGGSDAERPLTAEGQQRFRAAARGLGRLVRPDVLLTSPLRRARETAAIAAAAWGTPPAEATPALASGDLAQILSALDAQPAEATVAVVGHEPTVSALVAELTSAGDPEEAVATQDRVSFTPGAAALLELGSVEARDGRLVWFYEAAAAAALEGGGRPAQ